MKLKNIKPHMRGAAVHVGESVYQIDMEGICEVDKLEHVLILRQSAVWSVVRESAPPEEDPNAVTQEQEKLVAQVEAENEERRRVLAESSIESKSETGTEDNPEEQIDKLDEDQVGDPILGSTEDLPEFAMPTERWGKSSLQEYAGTMGIDYDPSTTKAELVEMIKAKLPKEG